MVLGGIGTRTGRITITFNLEGKLVFVIAHYIFCVMIDSYLNVVGYALECILLRPGRRNGGHFKPLKRTGSTQQIIVPRWRSHGFDIAGIICFGFMVRTKLNILTVPDHTGT
ncbi:hypothetical protein D3C72_2188340 [compost metagenome]